MNPPMPSELIIATAIVPTLANRANAIMQLHIRVHSNETVYTKSERDRIALLCISIGLRMSTVWFDGKTTGMVLVCLTPVNLSLKSSIYEPDNHTSLINLVSSKVLNSQHYKKQSNGIDYGALPVIVIPEPVYKRSFVLPGIELGISPSCVHSPNRWATEVADQSRFLISVKKIQSPKELLLIFASRKKKYFEYYFVWAYASRFRVCIWLTWWWRFY